ncbi:cell division protein FtsL [Falsiroseomonas sp. E2-1-a20]|uniref:cell division protein FtsL n=1 Tax=Falsiroseomonas sp. E2-1-a20 TaxID=3239300 RepID=UPI003F343A59
MIRPFTILCFCAFAGAGAWLYQVKHQVATQDRELRGIWREIEQARDRTSILRAEWALLNEPDRLRQVVQRHLPLEPMQPQQFTRLPEMERRLPAAIAFAGAPNLFVPETPAGAPIMMASTQAPQAPAPQVATPEPVRAAAPAARRPAPAAPVQAVAEAPRTDSLRAAEAPAPQVLAAAVAVQRATRAAQPAPAPRAAAPVREVPSREVPARQAPTREVQPAVHVTPVRPAAPPIRTTQAAPTAPTYVSALGGASSLGLGRPMMAPPVPFSSAAAATLDSGLAPPRGR